MTRGRIARLGPSSAHALRGLLLVAVLLLAACTRGSATPTPTRVANPSAGGTSRTVLGPTGTERKVDAILLEILDTYTSRGEAAAEQLARESGVLGEDDLVRAEKELDQITRAHVDEIDAALGRKEAELLEV